VVASSVQLLPQLLPFTFRRNVSSLLTGSCFGLFAFGLLGSRTSGLEPAARCFDGVVELPESEPRVELPAMSRLTILIACGYCLP